MKKAVITSFIVALCLLIIPLTNVKKEKSEGTTKAVSVSARASNTADKETDSSADSKKISSTVFRIKTDSGVKNIAAAEYVAGVVAAEMPSTYALEALKAQSVAAFTFALYRQSSRQTEDYDLTDSFKTDQSFLDDAALKEKWGETYDEKMSKITAAVDSTLGEYLSFDSNPALTVYHAVSASVTNSCADVFGGDLPYLVSVESEGDKLSPDYKSVFSFDTEDLVQKLSDIKTPSVTAENLLRDIKTSKSGFVLSLNYDGKEVSGSKFAGLLALPSANFMIGFSEGSYTVTCLGRGHGVGMSQYGANRMAEGGSSYIEILAHYYPGTKLEKR